MKIFSYSFIILLICSACSESGNNQGTSQNIVSEPISQGVLPYNTLFVNENMVISNGADWNALLENMESVKPGVTDSFLETEINFENYTILAVFDVRNSTSTIDITSIVEKSAEILVTVEQLQSGISQDVAHPYHIVKIPQTSKPVLFE